MWLLFQAPEGVLQAAPEGFTIRRAFNINLRKAFQVQHQGLKHACRSLSDDASMTMHLFSLEVQLQCVLCSSRAQYVSRQPGITSPVFASM
jgi:hypothetical protein